MAVNELIDMSKMSKREIFKFLPPAEQKKRLLSLSEAEAQSLVYDWDWYARPNQKTPQQDFVNWLIMAGRGFGKTRVGAQWVIEQNRLGFRFVNLIGRTAADVIDVMVNGESGIINSCHPSQRPVLKNGALHWPNGAISLLFSAMEPAALRGPQHEKLWCDEMAAWRYPEAWDMAKFGLRLGKNPQATITTTPRPTPLIKEILNDPSTIVIKGSTFDNKINLAPTFLNTVISKYEGTRLGRQEIYAEVLEDNANALWTHSMIEKSRVPLNDEKGNKIDYRFSRVVVGIDPATTSNENSDYTGIVVGAIGEDGFYYIIDDLSLLGKPYEWAMAAIAAYHNNKADRIVAETNNGGDMIESLIRSVDSSVSYKKVTATRGKMVRAEPIAALYEQGRVRHIGYFKELEDEMCEYTGLPGTKSPDRMDALVWVITELSGSKEFGFLNFIDQYNSDQEKKKQAEKPASTVGPWGF